MARSIIIYAHSNTQGDHLMAKFLDRKSVILPIALQIVIAVILLGIGAPETFAASPDPIGALDHASFAPGGLTVTGWALDSDAGTNPIDVHIYLDGIFAAPANANGNRPDIGALFPQYGGDHGFGATVAAAAGSHQICAFGINTGNGSNQLLGCRSATVPGPDPLGRLDGASIVPGPAGELRIEGWTIDPDDASPIDVHVYINGSGMPPVQAQLNRSDIGSAFPAYGPGHGFSLRVPTTYGSFREGENTVCVYGINSGAGNNSNLGCRTVLIRKNPFGNLETAQQIPGGLRVKGWAIDPNSDAAIPVHVYADGSPLGSITASDSRSDVTTYFPEYGQNHGFSADFSISPGIHTVCAYGISSGPGENSLLGCRTVNMGVSPIGSLEWAGSIFPEYANTILLNGWALDTETSQPIDVHIHVNGVPQAAYTADDSRPDLLGPFSGYGSNHGFSTYVSPVAGRNNVCVYAINRYNGANTLLGCKVVDVPVNPIGSFDAWRFPASNCVEASGWTLDPDAAGWIEVRFYLNGIFKRSIPASVYRGDIGSIYDLYGPYHGFKEMFDVGLYGDISLCAYGINVGTGDSHTLLGCKTQSRPPYAGQPPRVVPSCQTFSN